MALTMLSRRRRWRHRPTTVIRALLVLMVVVSTGIRFENGPIYDDVYVIGKAGIIHQPKLALEVFQHSTMFISTNPPDSVAKVDTYRPIPVLTFFLNSAISGRRLWSYHLFNMVLHVTCVLLLFALIRRWIGVAQLKAALLGAAFFALHPWLAEAHVWINGRSDPLALAFALGATLVLLGPPGGTMTVRRLTTAGVLFFCGLLCKETLLTTVPAFLFLNPKRATTTKATTLSWRARAETIAPLVVASCVYLVLRIRVLGGMRAHDDAHSLYIAALRGPVLVFDALYHLIVPSFPFLRSLRDDLDALPKWLLVAPFVALAACAVVVYRRRRTWTSGPFAALFFAGSLAPIAGISVVLWPGYGRYLYLPAAGFALAIAEMTSLLEPRLHKRGRAIFWGCMTAYLVALMGLLVSFTRDMDSDETLYLTAIDRRPNQAYGWGFLGLHYTSTGLDDPGIGALKHAIELDPSEHRYQARLALVLSAHHRCDEVTELAQKGIDRFPGPRAAVYHFALARCAPDLRVAVHHLRACLILRPTRIDCETDLRLFLTTHPDTTRAALRDDMKSMPFEAFDAKWAELVAHEPFP